jgi:putative drug exporter of the RND superfamily
MFASIGRSVVSHRRWVMAATMVFLVAAGALGSGVFGQLTSGGFFDEGSEAFTAAATLEDRFGVRDPNLVLLVTADSGSVDSARAREAGRDLTEELESEEGVDQVTSYWTTGSPAFRSEAGDQALVIGVLTGGDDEATETLERITPEVAGDRGPIEVAVGGSQEVFRAVTDRVESDLARAESIAIPITLALLVLVFGSVVAATLPLVIGGIAIVGSFLVLRVLTQFTDVSVFALNLITMLGLGLGIDYSLFVVSRFREEMRKGLPSDEAVVHTVATAGRTVAFSALTVVISLGALLLFPMTFLRSFAYAGIAVIVLAAIAAVVFLPALLAALGPRVDSLSLRRRKPASESDGFWHRVANAVMRRPLPIATAIIVVLLVLGAPFLGVEWGTVDHRVLPQNDAARRTSAAIADRFPVNNAETLNVVASDAGDPRSLSSEIDSYAAGLSTLEGVGSVESLTGTYSDGRRTSEPDPSSARFGNEDGTWLSVHPASDTDPEEREQLVDDLRSLPAPFEIDVTGVAALDADTRDTLFSRVPVAGLLIAAVTFVLLFLMFGSVLVPLKAIVLNLLSLTASFGAVVWIFQEGNLASVLNFTATGTIEVTSPILMFCIAFGLSMDYEVFLLSRIKEEHDRTGDNTRSVALGLERTGRIVTAAAALLSVVFLAFATSGVTFIKLMGIGLTLAVIVDATLVRATLVPAFMRLAGRANWWAPRWMSAVYDRFGIGELGPVGVRPRGSEGKA